MTGLVGALRVVLGLNSSAYESGMRRAGQTARRTGTDISRSLQAAQRTAVNAFRGIAAAAGIGGGIAAAATFARYVDAAKQLEAQLRLATRESGNFAQAQEDVRRIAQASRSDIEAVGNLYATIQRSARELGISQGEAARMTETITKAFQISGATAEEAAGGLRQFLQGIQSGTLRGEELNSVLENAPRLARALADGLGVTIGQLREMGAAGQLTGEAVTEAILRASEAIDSEFRQIPVTFDQAMTQVRNAAVVAFGAFDRGGEFSNALINFAGTGQMSFDQIEQYAFQTGQEIRAIMNGLANVFDPMGEGASSVFEFIMNEARGLRAGLQDVFNTIGMAWDSAAAGMAMAAMQPGESIRIMQEGAAQRALGGAFRAGGGTAIGQAITNAAAVAARARDRVPGSAPPRRPTTSVPAGGGGGRRRRAGGGRTRRAETLTRSGDLESYMVNPWVHGRSIAEMEADAQQLDAWLNRSTETLGEMTAAIPDLSQMLTVEEQERIQGFAENVYGDLSRGLAEAIVRGRNLGDVLVNTFQRAASAMLEAGIFDLLTGQGFGGKTGAGGFLNWIGAAIGGFRGGGNGGGVVPGKLPGFATGGSFMVGGHAGIDRNMLSLNGMPVARVSRGETVGVGWGGGGKVEIVLRDEMLDARISEGAGAVVTRAYPGMKADVMSTINQQRRRA
jgi:tape measure domain-containing protein